MAEPYNSYDDLPFDDSDSYHSEKIAAKITDTKIAPVSTIACAPEESLVTSRVDLDTTNNTSSAEHSVPMMPDLYRYEDLKLKIVKFSEMPASTSRVAKTRSSTVKKHKLFSSTPRHSLIYPIDEHPRSSWPGSRSGVKDVERALKRKSEKHKVSKQRDNCFKHPSTKKQTKYGFQMGDSQISYSLDSQPHSSNTDTDISILSTVPAYGMDISDAKDRTYKSRTRSSKNPYRHWRYSRGSHLDSVVDEMSHRYHLGDRLSSRHWNYIHSSAERRRQNSLLFPAGSHGDSRSVAMDQVYETTITSQSRLEDSSLCTTTTYGAQDAVDGQQGLGGIGYDSTIRSYRDHVYENYQAPPTTTNETGIATRPIGQRDFDNKSISSTCHHFGVYASDRVATPSFDDNTYQSIAEASRFDRTRSSRVPIHRRSGASSTAQLQALREKHASSRNPVGSGPSTPLANADHNTPSCSGTSATKMVKLIISLTSKDLKTLETSPDGISVQLEHGSSSITAMVDLQDLTRRLYEIESSPSSDPSSALIHLVPRP